jgi:hypothetical protein
MVQLGGLGRKMAGDLNIEPILNLGSQMKDFYGHNRIPLQFRGPPKPTGGPKGNPSRENLTSASRCI